MRKMLEDLFAAHVEGMREALDLPKLEQRLCTLEAKAKEPEKQECICVRMFPQPLGHIHDCPLYEGPKPSGWRASEFPNIMGFSSPNHLIEVHPRAARVRMHIVIADGRKVVVDQCWRGDRCDDEHAEFLQISSEPAVKP
jgi:hypothetical protein